MKIKPWKHMPSSFIHWHGTILEQIPEIKNLDKFCIKLSSFKNKANIHLK
jgi:hypothetical protein